MTNEQLTLESQVLCCQQERGVLVSGFPNPAWIPVEKKSLSATRLPSQALTWNLLIGTASLEHRDEHLRPNLGAAGLHGNIESIP